MAEDMLRQHWSPPRLKYLSIADDNLCACKSPTSQKSRTLSHRPKSCTGGQGIGAARRVRSPLTDSARSVKLSTEVAYASSVRVRKGREIP